MWSSLARTFLVVAALLAIGPAGMPAPSAVAQSASCEDFQFFEFAQSVYESDPATWGDLDPDGDGVACPDLENGVAPALWTDTVPAGATKVNLVRVVDGDTMVFDTPAGDDTIRIIMADTPETKHPNDPVECYGPEATAYADWLLGQDADIYLEKDITERDKYQRLLRYVWLDFGGGFVVQLNEAIVRSGHGIVVTYPPDVKYVDQLREAQDFAVRHGLGLWSACGGADTTIGIADPTAVAGGTSGSSSGSGSGDNAWRQEQPSGPAAAPPTGGGACDPSYPDFCVASSPDLDCKEIPQRRFRVVGADPHNFDGNHDGVGCESD
jgi:micrococcal nuclease